MHLTLKGINGNKIKLEDLEECYDYLNQVVEVCGMTKIIEPYVIKYNGKHKNDDGITGVILLAESHATIHTFPDHGTGYFDLFSCKPFDYNKVIELLDVFYFEKVESNLIKRGLVEDIENKRIEEQENCYQRVFGV